MPFSTLAFSPDGKTLAVGGYKEVLVWDLVDATLLKRIGKGRLNGPARALAFGKEGSLLAVGEGLPGRSGGVRIFNITSGELFMDFRDAKDVIDTVAFSPDGKQLAASGVDPTVWVWNLDKVKLVAAIKEHRNGVRSVAFSADGYYLATAGADNTAQIWEAGSWKSISRMTQSGPVNSAGFGPYGDVIALAVDGPGEKGVRIQRVEYPEPPETSGTQAPTTTGTAQSTPPKPKEESADKGKKKGQSQQIKTLNTGAGVPLMAIWNNKGDRLYVPCTDRTIQVFNPNASLVATLRGHEDWVYGAALSPDGSKLASGSADGTVKLWNTANHQLLATLVQTTPATDQWVIITPQGDLATSVPTAIRWDIAGVQSENPELTKQRQNPDAVRQALSGTQASAQQKPKPRFEEGPPKK